MVKLKKKDAEAVRFAGRKVFLGESTKEDRDWFFAFLVLDLGLYGAVKTPEEVALHNYAVRLLDILGINPAIDIKRPKVLQFEVMYEDPYKEGAGSIPEGVQDTRRVSE